jgi:predicted NACHT family NTPase
MFNAIKMLSERHPNACPILSCRDTVRLPAWRSAFVVKMRAFGDDQLARFIGNWFPSQDMAIGLHEWLKGNKGMKDAARTPIIAALLCSLYEAGADMPETEAELYQRRFELLLGRWETAKGIRSLIPAEIRRFWLFLSALAMHFQQEEVRAGDYKTVSKFANRYRLPTLHASAGEMIEDCIRRGVLEREGTGGITFGHLTYQEFMAAEWLSERNPVDFIVGLLNKSWWTKTVEFYATKKQDISPIIDYACGLHPDGYLRDRLLSLKDLASVTTDDAWHRLQILVAAQRSYHTVDWDRFPSKIKII